MKLFIGDVLTTELTVDWIRASYVRPWEAQFTWPGRHDAPPNVALWDDVRLEDEAGIVLFRGNIIGMAPGGVAEEGVIFTAADGRFRLENEPVRINGRGFYVWNRRGHSCQGGWGGEDNPGCDGAKWTCGEIIIDILEHALGIPAEGSDIDGHHGDACCVSDPFLTSSDVAGYDPDDILALNSVVGEFSVDNTPVAQAVGLLLALNGGFYGWYIDPADGRLVVADLDALPVSDLEAGELGHWVDEAGTDYMLLGNKLEWSLDGVASTVVVQGTDRTIEVRPGNIQDKDTGDPSGAPALGGGGKLEFVAAPWHGWPAAYRALCQPRRIPTSKPIDLASAFTPPYGWSGGNHLPRLYRGVGEQGMKTAYYPASGIHPRWLLSTGIIAFREVPLLGLGESLWAWYWASVPFTVSAGPDGDAWHWYGYERTRTVYDPNFRHPTSWPQSGTPDDETAMGVLAERLLRMFRDVRRQGVLTCDGVDFATIGLQRRYSVQNLGPEFVPPPGTTTEGTATTTQIGGYDDPAAWPSLKINAVEVLYDFAAQAAEITVANTFWMLEDYSELKRRLEQNLFVQREFDLSQDLFECQVRDPIVDDPTTMEPSTTAAPPTTPSPTTTTQPSSTTTPDPSTTTTTVAPPPTTTTTDGEAPTTTTTTPGPTTTVQPTTTEAPGCPGDCLACADTYYVDPDICCGHFVCCEEPLQMEQYSHLPNPGSCIWLSGAAACQATLNCSDGKWWLRIVHGPTGDECRYRRVATPSSCPAGVYELYGDASSCSDCPATVTVYS